MNPRGRNQHTEQWATGFCYHGHELTDETIVVEPNGVRRCGTCRRARWKAAKERRRSALKLASSNGEAVTPKEDWVDVVAVERAVAGYPEVGRELTRAERIEVGRLLVAKGRNRTEAANSLGFSWKTFRELVLGGEEAA